MWPILPAGCPWQWRRMAGFVAIPPERCRAPLQLGCETSPAIKKNHPSWRLGLTFLVGCLFSGLVGWHFFQKNSIAAPLCQHLRGGPLQHCVRWFFLGGCVLHTIFNLLGSVTPYRHDQLWWMQRGKSFKWWHPELHPGPCCKSLNIQDKLQPFTYLVLQHATLHVSGTQFSTGPM